MICLMTNRLLITLGNGGEDKASDPAGWYYRYSTRSKPRSPGPKDVVQIPEDRFKVKACGVVPVIWGGG